METKIHTAVFLEEKIQLIRDKSSTVAVICGSDALACSSLDIVRKDETSYQGPASHAVRKGISDDHAYEEGYLNKMMACEKELIKSLMEEVGSISEVSEKIRAIVKDPTVFTHCLQSTERQQSSCFWDGPGLWLTDDLSADASTYSAGMMAFLLLDF